MRTRIIFASLTLLSLFSSSKGNDTFATLGAGGLVPVRTTQVVMESEDLQISSHQIFVRYVFRNITNRDVEAVVAFPLPDLNGGDVYNEPMTLPDASQINFVDFTVTSDGREVSPAWSHAHGLTTGISLRAFNPPTCPCRFCSNL